MEKDNFNQHRVLPVLQVFLVLLAYCYLFTHVSDWLGLPAPRELASALDWTPDHVFDPSDGNVDSNLWIAKTSQVDGRLNYDDERLVLFAAIFGAFLSVYFLPFRFKQGSVVIWFILAFLILYRDVVTSAFVASHLVVYLLFHPRSRQRTMASGAFGFLASYCWLQGSSMPGVAMAVLSIAGGACFVEVDRSFLRPFLLLRMKVADRLRTLVVQLPLLVGCGAALWEGVFHQELKLTLGILLIFWQWHRLMVYHADYVDEAVPRDLPLFSYFSIFMTPAVITNWTYSPYVGQAHAYLSKRFYCEDKNETLRSGLRLWILVLFYLVCGEWMIHGVVTAARELCSVKLYPFTTWMINDYMNGQPMGTLTVLGSTILYQARVLLVFGAVTHFRVGAFRVFGYRVDPQYDRPWMATNLVTFWRRFAFHYREFVVRIFYYPVFLRFFKKHRILRVFVATLVATSVGNHIWGHVPDRMLSRGMEFVNLKDILRAWPYYLFLGLGISLTQIYLLRQGRTRKAWTPGIRVVLDVVCAYATLQFFCLIHIFARPPQGGSAVDSLKLFLIGFGIHL